MKKKKDLSRGWSTLELVLLLPCIVGLIGLLFYFGQLAFFHLHLTSVVDAAARISAIQDCDRGKRFVSDSFKGNLQIITTCTEDEYISMEAKSEFHSFIPFFDSVKKTVRVKAFALNEQSDEEDE